MNTHDLSEQKAAEFLREVGYPLTRENLNIGTCMFLRGWVHGLEDAEALSDRSDAQTDARIKAGFKRLRELTGMK